MNRLNDAIYTSDAALAEYKARFNADPSESNRLLVAYEKHLNNRYRRMRSRLEGWYTEGPERAHNPDPARTLQRDGLKVVEPWRYNA